MIEQLVPKVLATRNAAHMAHWKTKSYAQHIALDEFYTEILDALDNLVETYQGAFGLIDLNAPMGIVPKDIVAHIGAEAQWIDANRSKIAKNLGSLENIVDELTGVYLKSFYKLTNLS
jgi:hypothetical protein